MELTRREFMGAIGTGLLASACPRSNVPIVVGEEHFIDYYLPEGGTQNLKINVWRPENLINDIPIFAFSPGFAASPNNYSDFLHGVASRGYLVVAPEHTDYINYRTDTGSVSFDNLPRAFSDMRDVLDEVGNIPGYESASFIEIVNLFVSQGINLLTESEFRDAFESMFGYRDQELRESYRFGRTLMKSKGVYGNKVAVSGHSLGGSMPIEAVVLDHHDEVDAGLFLSPIAPAYDFSKIKVPTRTLSGTLDSFYSSSRDIYDQIPNDKSFVSFDDVGHATFAQGACNSGISIGNEDEIACSDYDWKARLILDASVSFLDHYLKGLGSEDAFLVNGNVSEYLKE
jgi:dienelactone hydrolase